MTTLTTPFPSSRQAARVGRAPDNQAGSTMANQWQRDHGMQWLPVELLQKTNVEYIMQFFAPGV
jgi:hypothetical protein